VERGTAVLECGFLTRQVAASAPLYNLSSTVEVTVSYESGVLRKMLIQGAFVRGRRNPGVG
jgi:hypothetical protein